MMINTDTLDLMMVLDLEVQDGYFNDKIQLIINNKLSLIIIKHYYK